MRKTLRRKVQWKMRAIPQHMIFCPLSQILHLKIGIVTVGIVNMVLFM